MTENSGCGPFLMRRRSGNLLTHILMAMDIFVIGFPSPHHIERVAPSLIRRSPEIGAGRGTL